MSEDMSDRMPEDLPARKCINVMVGITRSKVIFIKQRETAHKVVSHFEGKPLAKITTTMVTTSTIWLFNVAMENHHL